jgi:hypothetical protein
VRPAYRRVRGTGEEHEHSGRRSVGLLVLAADPAVV